MTEYELLDIALAYQDGWITHFMNFVTVFSAYLICAYLVGDKLSRLQLSIINLAYTAFVGSAAIWAYVNNNRFFYYTQLALDRSSDVSLIAGGPPEPNLALTTPVLIGLTYAGSLVFMFQKRNKLLDRE